MLKDSWIALSLKKGKVIASSIIGGERIVCGYCLHYEHRSLPDDRAFMNRRPVLTDIRPMQSDCPFCRAHLYWRQIKRTEKFSKGRKIIIDKQEGA